MTSPAGGASEIGRPCPPAQTIPVKWTGLPAELILSPPWSATRACHATQSRSCTQGSRIAAPQPGIGIASGLRITSRSPFAILAPSLQAPAKPALWPLVWSRAPGASSRTSSAEPSPELLSTTISSSPSPSSGTTAGSVRANSSRLFQAMIRTESVGGTDAGG